MPSRSPAKKRTHPAQSRPRTPTATRDTFEYDVKAQRLFLAVVVALYLVFAAAFNRLIPFRSGPEAARLIHSMQLSTNADEAAHVANAEVYRSGHIPVFHAGSPDFEAHQPPLYYALIAPLLAGTHSDQPAILARWFGILLGALTILATYAAVQATFSDRPEIAMACAAFVGLLPMNINLCASISNDVLTNLIVIVGLWMIASTARRTIKEGPSHLVRDAILLGVILATGLYTKTSTLVLFPAVVAAAWMMARERIVSIPRAIAFGTIAILLGGAIAAPWLIRNTRLYGDPLAQHIFESAFINTTMTAQRMMAMTHQSAAGYALLVARLTFDSFWGIFDGMLLPMPTIVYAVLGLASVAALPGAWRWFRRESFDAAQRVTLAAMILVLLGTLAAFARFNMTFFQAQGRYLYTALLPIAFLVTVGIEGLWPDRVRRLPYYVVAAMLLVDAVALHTMTSVFG